MQLIPDFIQRKIAHRPNLVKIVDNIGWLFIDRFLRMGVGLLVGVWVARYLGPAQYGLLNYALAFVALFGAIATLGLKDIVVRDLVRQPATGGLTLGTAFVLRLIGGFGAFVLILGTMAWLRPDDIVTKTMVAILGFSLIFKASEVISYWFESQVQSKYVVWITNSVFFLVAGIKVILILNGAPLMVFVWLVLFESVLVAVGLSVSYVLCNRSLLDWSFQRHRARILLKESWPLMFSSIAIMIYMRIDQLMLGEMLGEEAVGIYSAALRISEIWYMIPMIIVASLFPAIIEAKETDEKQFEFRLQRLLSLMASLSIIIALVVSTLSGLLISFLYGQDYSDASDVLKIHIWAGIFVFLGVVGSRWYILNDLQHLNMYRTVAGAVINVLLNLVMIPRYGPEGAAVSTVISYFFAAYLLDAASKRTMPLFKYKSIAIFIGPIAMVLSKRSSS